MKRGIFLLVFILALFAQIPVFAGDINFSLDRGDMVGIVRDMTLDKPTDGNVVAVLGNLDIHAEVGGNIVAVLGNVKIDSKVSGNVVAVFGKVTLTQKAVVMGSTVAIGEMEKLPGAKTNGPEATLYLGFLPMGYLNVVLLAAIITFAVFLFLTGVIAIPLSRERFGNMAADMAASFGRKLGIGVLAYLGCTIFLPFIAITVVAPILYFILLIGAGITASIYTGKLVLRSFHSSYSIYLEFFMGFIIITLVKVMLVVFMPESGYAWMLIYGGLYLIFGFLINSLGLGILIDSKFGSRNKRI